MGTKFSIWRNEEKNYCFCLAEDDSYILDIFVNCFGSTGSVMSEDEFICDVKAIKDQVCFVVVDGTLSGKGWEATISEWLDYHGLSTDSSSKKFVIGFSGDNRNKTDKCYRWYLKGTIPSLAVKSLIDYCDKTTIGSIKIEDWPPSLPNPISDLIHTLDNFLTPIRLDSETLRELINLTNNNEQLSKAYEEIWNDHLGSGSVGYLGWASKQHKGKDALSFVRDIVQELGKGMISEDYNSFKKSVKELQTYDEAFRPGINATIDFESRLRNINEAGQQIVAALRELRRKQNEGS